MRRGVVAGVLVAAAACQGGGAPAANGSASASAVVAVDAAAPAIVAAPDVDGGDEGSGSGSAAPASETPEIANGGDQSDDVDAIAKSATSAWQAVIDRDLYLGRRGQKGIVAGRVDGLVNPPAPTPTPAPTTGTGTGTGTASGTGSASASASGTGTASATGLFWLVDDTESDGCLAIRVVFPATAPKRGTRVALSGSWALDDSKHWYWKAESVTELPNGPPPPGDPSPPGHGIAAAPAPADARPVSKLGDGNGTIVFQVIAPPRRDGDGWVVASQLGDPGVARLVLPGDRPSYGGHDLRTTDEKWQLAKAATYWVRVGTARHPPPVKPGGNPIDALPVVHALGAPRRIP